MLKRSSIVSVTAGLVCLIMFGCSSPTKAPIPLDAPTLRSPNDGVQFQPDILTLIWNPSPEATSYSVQVSTTSNFSTLTVNSSSLSPSFAITSPLGNDSTYFWRVSASKDGQRTSAWSATFSFTTGVAAPSNLQPQDGSMLEPDTLTLTWYASPGATTYDVQLSTDNTFSTFTIDTSISLPSFAITSPLSADEVTYYWRVRVLIPQGLSAWSATQSFVTWNMPAPRLLTPADGANSVSLTDSLIWHKPSGWLVSSYHVQVSTASDFSSNVVVNNSGVSDTVLGTFDSTHYFFSLTSSSLTSGTLYYWRVASIDFLSRQSAWWSAVWSFTTQ